MNHCAGCHSLQYVRYKDMAKDIGIVDKKGIVLEKLVNSNLNFTSDKATDPILVATPKKESMKWFGVAPPDLSLAARVRGTDWLYTYLRSFYIDPKRPWGVNNVVFPDVGMPHILLTLQGTQVPVYKTETLHDDEGKPYEKQIISHLELKTPGTLTKDEYDKAMTDLVNFLDYVGEPHKLERQRLGVWVLLFLVVFTLFAYLLKREYWKDVH
jgi:ubiquinol-cytochrome c reductase cytochrome c1 subunit